MNTCRSGEPSGFEHKEGRVNTKGGDSNGGQYFDGYHE